MQFECAWELETDDLPATAILCLAKRNPFPPITAKRYTWIVNATPGAPQPPSFWELEINWDVEDWPEPATTAADCHKGRTLVHATLPYVFEIEPVPVYICTQAELEGI